MSSTKGTVFSICLCVLLMSYKTSAQLELGEALPFLSGMFGMGGMGGMGGGGLFSNPMMMLTDAGGNMMENGVAPFMAISNVLKRLLSMERSIAANANSGCEVGQVGPLNSGFTTNTISFRTRFPRPPVVTVSLNSLKTINSGSIQDFSVIVSGVTTQGATVRLQDSGLNVDSVFFSYMACPGSGV